MSIRRLLRKTIVLVLIVAVIGAVGLFLWLRFATPRPGSVRDEALQVRREAASFVAADEDFFRDMDRVASPEGARVMPLTPEEVKGRNTLECLDRGQRSDVG